MPEDNLTQDEQRSRQREYEQRYEQTDQGRETRSAYKQSGKSRETIRAYNHSDNGRKARRAYNQSDKGRATRREASRRYLARKAAKARAGGDGASVPVSGVVAEGAQGLPVAYAHAGPAAYPGHGNDPALPLRRSANAAVDAPPGADFEVHPPVLGQAASQRPAELPASDAGLPSIRQLFPDLARGGASAAPDAFSASGVDGQRVLPSLGQMFPNPARNGASAVPDASLASGVDAQRALPSIRQLFPDLGRHGASAAPDASATWRGGGGPVSGSSPDRLAVRRGR